jgi:hypothetical protein
MFGFGINSSTQIRVRRIAPIQIEQLHYHIMAIVKMCGLNILQTIWQMTMSTLQRHIHPLRYLLINLFKIICSQQSLRIKQYIQHL